MKKIILAILFASFFLISARAASFDCEKTSTNIEKLVCSDIVLSKLDETLSTLYQQSIEQSDDKQHAIGEQKIWLRTVRNVCPDSLCLRNSYDARINVLNERLKLTAYVESSYFLDTPERSIDEMMAGCFADITCSAQAEVFVPAYSKASNIPEADLRATLRDCLATQGSMNECVGYEQYVISREMSEALRLATQDISSTCRSAVGRQQVKWKKKTWDACYKKAYSDFGQGTALGGVAMSCNTEHIIERVKSFQLVGTCSPCSKCLEIP